MPVCHVCDAVDDFDDEGGLYYCNVCSTQSQSMQVLEQEVTYSNITSGRSLAVKVAAKPRKDLLVELTKSKPWWSYEAFQIILQAQIETLIAMGVSHHLSEVVKTIWFKFLQKSGVAFCTTSTETMSMYRKIAEKRELEVREREKAKRKRLEQAKQKKQLERDSLEKVEGMDSGLDTDENINSNVADNSDAISMKSNSSVRSARSTASSRKSGCSDRHISMARKINKEPHIRILSLRHLVCFLYIGLRYLKEPIIMNDLVRWIQIGKLPFYGTDDLLPNYIVASMGASEQRKFKCREIPGLPNFEKLWRSLTTYLLIENLPPPGLSLLVSRFVVDLNLPNEILALTKRILLCKLNRSQCSKRKRKDKKRHPLYELEALAAIVVVLKLCFRLDDDFEYEQSSLCRRVNECCEAGSDYFIWNEWVLSQQVKVQEQQKTAVHEQACNILRIQNLEPFINFEKNIYNKWLGGETSFQGWASNKMETRNEMMKPFVALSDNRDVQDVQASSFVHKHPLQVTSEDCITKHDGMSLYIREALLSKDFSLTSLRYALHVASASEKNSSTLHVASAREKNSSWLNSSEDCVEQENCLLEKQEEYLSEEDNDDDIWKTQMKKGQSCDDSLECVPPSVDEYDSMLASSSSPQRGTKRTWSRIKTLDICNQQNFTNLNEQNNDEIGQNTKKMKQNSTTETNDEGTKKHVCKNLQKRLDKMSQSQSYIVYPKLDVRRSGLRFHYSYTWLLKHLSRMVGQDFLSLHDEVLRFEYLLDL
ncbi:TATA box-binding protein-associated factor RNA polymerase I subunit B-like [Antedon mediterranea]|uniref:TATA box-binding protein-associated factor RNA polymerase I subunit B-like n=1 Tax=Antedon mediterranea TaxID=105859 RepID=UPI003AF8932F